MDVFTAMSFCSGYEGIGLGLKRAIPNLRTICYVENEAYAIANLVAKIKENKLDDAPVWDDIKTFDPKPFAGLVDIIHSGYPCQPFSVAGKQKGETDPRHLWPFIKDHIKQIKPVWVFLENVAGHLRLGFDRVVRDLDELGYRVEADLFTASEVGAPHKRERLFILAHDTSVGRTAWGPEPTGQCGQASIAGGGNVADAAGPGKLGLSQSQRCGEAGPDCQRPPWLSNTETRPASEISRIQKAENGPDSQGRPDAAGNIGGILGTDGGNREEMANPQRLGRRGRDNGEPVGQGRALQTEGSGKLANTEATERGRVSEKYAERGAAEIGGPGGGELAEPTSSRSPEDRQQCELWADSIGKSPCNQGDCSARQESQGRWPARPGQEQYDWEEPRTVESGMGRTVDGVASRVDELRLLGNGVVPAQAELAFRTLYKKMAGNNRENLATK